jgi:hypothetical protein
MKYNFNNEVKLFMIFVRFVMHILFGVQHGECFLSIKILKMQKTCLIAEVCQETD